MHLCSHPEGLKCLITVVAINHFLSCIWSLKRESVLCLLHRRCFWMVIFGSNPGCVSSSSRESCFHRSFFPVSLQSQVLEPVPLHICCPSFDNSFLSRAVALDSSLGLPWSIHAVTAP